MRRNLRTRFLARVEQLANVFADPAAHWHVRDMGRAVLASAPNDGDSTLAAGLRRIRAHVRNEVRAALKRAGIL